MPYSAPCKSVQRNAAFNIKYLSARRRCNQQTRPALVAVSSTLAERVLGATQLGAFHCSFAVLHYPTTALIEPERRKQGLGCRGGGGVRRARCCRGVDKTDKRERREARERDVRRSL